MIVPNAEIAEVHTSKLIDYLLSDNHPDGWSKARFFKRFGFSISNLEVMASALKTHLVLNEFVKEERTRFGTRYVVEGKIQTPTGKFPFIRSVWFVMTGELTPRLTTAYPIKEKVNDNGTR